MNHERFRELLALDLYGELDAAERDALEDHLSTCPPCRAFRSELASGLGALSGAGAAPAAELAWIEARAREATVARAPAHAVPPAARPAWLGFAAGLAAGVAATLLAVGPSRGRQEPGPRTTVEPTTRGEPPVLAFARSEPPPRASTSGPLAMLADLRRR